MPWGDPIVATVVSIGVPTVFAQSKIYALPARAIYLQATAVLETSLDNSTYTTVAATTTGVILAAGFARCTSGTATVLCKLQ